MQEPRYSPAAPSLLDSSWKGDDENHLLNTPASILDYGFRPVDATSPHEVVDLGSPEVGDKGDLLSAPQASTQLVIHPISTDTDSRNQCKCISCLGIWKSQNPLYRKDGEAYYSCRLSGCLHIESIRPNSDKYSRMFSLAELRRHEKAHFGTNGHFKCLSDHCTFVTKRRSDLKRHSTVMPSISTGKLMNSSKSKESLKSRELWSILIL